MTSKGDNYQVADIGLAEKGRMRIDWAESRMPVLMALREQHGPRQSLKGMRVAGCLHVTKETAVLVETLRAAGAEVSWSGCNPLSTQDEVAAALAARGTSIYAWHGMTVEEFYWAIDRTIDPKNRIQLPSQLRAAIEDDEDGKGLYIMGDDGHMYVFGHLSKFSREIPV